MAVSSWFMVNKLVNNLANNGWWILNHVWQWFKLETSHHGSPGLRWSEVVTITMMYYRDQRSNNSHQHVLAARPWRCENPLDTPLCSMEKFKPSVIHNRFLLLWCWRAPNWTSLSQHRSLTVGKNLWWIWWPLDGEWLIHGELLGPIVWWQWSYESLNLGAVSCHWLSQWQMRLQAIWSRP